MMGKYPSIKNPNTDPRKDIANGTVFPAKLIFLQGHPCCGRHNRRRKNEVLKLEQDNEIIGYNETDHTEIVRVYCRCGQHFLIRRKGLKPQF